VNFAIICSMQAFTHIFETIQQLKQKHADDERRNAEALKRAKEEIEALLKQAREKKADAKERS
jgi:uncharacterized protein YpuA (DUF1002 family)